MPIQLTLNKNAVAKGVPVKIFTNDIEDDAIRQLRTLS